MTLTLKDMETITIKKTHKDVWMKRFDDYEKKFTRISKKEGLESLKLAGRIICNDGEPVSGRYQMWCYVN